MPYVILVGGDNSLTTTRKERIMQRSKLVDNLWILAYPIYKGQDMSEYTVYIEYVLPCSRRYCTEILQLSDEMYEDHLKYTLPFDTKLTTESGEIEAQLTFVKVDIDENGNDIQRVRKTSTCKIDITPISAWSDIIPDSALTALDQRIIKMDAQIKAINDMNDTLNDTKADNIIRENNKLQLTANGKRIGDVIDIKSDDCCSEDGVPVVDFSNTTGSVTPDDSTKPNGNYNNVVEF